MGNADDVSLVMVVVVVVVVLLLLLLLLLLLKIRFDAQQGLLVALHRTADFLPQINRSAFHSGDGHCVPSWAWR